MKDVLQFPGKPIFAGWIQTGYKPPKVAPTKPRKKRKPRPGAKPKCRCGCGQAAKWPMEGTPIFARRICGYRMAVKLFGAKK